MTEPGVQRIPEAPDLPHRLGRHVEHDPRSRSFAFAAPEPMPLRDVSWKRLVGPYDQGDLGSCTANALCGALSTYPFKHHFSSQKNIVKVYSRATWIDDFDGHYKPDDTGSSGLAVAKVALERGWISRYEHAFSFDAMLQALMVGPVIVGTAWHEDMFRPDPSGRVRPTGAVVGGHEWEIYGVDTFNRLLWAWNSWSKGWGIGGRFNIGWDDMRALLADDGDCTILVP
jgi:hypothetical protein